MSRYFLEARSVSLVRGDQQLLSGVSFGVHRGELVALLGPSGSGKSTLLRLLGGLEPPDEGQVLLGGEDVAGLDPARVARTIGMVPQDDVLHTELPLRRMLEYAARLRLPPAAGEAEVKAAVDRVLAAVELEQRAGLRIHRLSGGQRKRASLGVELLLAPPALLLDEPTSGLDPDLEQSTMRLFRRLASEGRAVLTTTHSLASIGLCDLVVVIVKGFLAYAGPPGALEAHFEVPDPDLIFKKLREGSPASWANRYRQSPLAERTRSRPAPAVEEAPS